VLRNYNGKGNDLGQEGAITRFLARELGYDGGSDWAEADMMYCFFFSTMRNNGVSHDGQEFSVAALRDAGGSKMEDRPTYQETFRLNDLDKAERSLLALDYFEERLAASSGPFLLGSDPCYVDFGIFYILFELGEVNNCTDWREKFGLPHLGRLLDAVAAKPNVEEFLASPRRMPRYERANDGKSLYTYIEGKLSPNHANLT